MDEGLGISKQELPNLFKEFGFWLRISTLKRLANDLEIKIEVVSEVGIGGEFIVIFK